MSIRNTYESLYYELYKEGKANLLNSKPPGDNGIITDEARAKISNFWKGRKRSKDQIDKHRKYMKGKTFRKGKPSTEEYKIRMSEAKKGINNNTREHIERINEIRRGKPMPREAIERMMKTRLERGSFKKLTQCIQS